MSAGSQQFHFIIPTGTKVVSRHYRRVGIVVHAPAAMENAYRVRFAEGDEASFFRTQKTRLIAFSKPDSIGILHCCRRMHNDADPAVVPAYNFSARRNDEMELLRSSGHIFSSRSA